DDPLIVVNDLKALDGKVLVLEFSDRLWHPCPACWSWLRPSCPLSDGHARRDACSRVGTPRLQDSGRNGLAEGFELLGGREAVQEFLHPPLNSPPGGRKDRLNHE